MTSATPGVYGLQVGGDGSPLSVLRVNDRPTHAGNIVLEAGRQNTGGRGWSKTEHIVITRDELPGLLAELAEHWLAANPDAGVTLALDPDEAGDVQHALSIAVSLIRQVGIQPGGGLTSESEARLLWQRTPAGTRWMRSATGRLPPVPVAHAVVEARARRMSVVTVKDRSDTVSLTVVVDGDDEGTWWAHDTMSYGHAADTPGVALEDFARRAAADADTRTEALRTAAGGTGRLGELADEAARILQDRRRLLEHVREHADTLGDTVTTATEGKTP